MRRRRRMAGLGIAVVTVALSIASTAYACVFLKGNATVTGSTQASNRMTGNEAHGYCAGGEPVTAATGPAASVVSAAFGPANTCTGLDGVNQLTDGTYDVRLRNSNAGYAGTDGQAWTQVPLSGCFAAPVGLNNYDLGDMQVKGGSGNGSWSIPSTAVPNGPNDASIFCVGRKDPATGTASGASDGFLAPFRVVL